MFESPAALIRYQQELPLTPGLPGRSRILKNCGPKKKDSVLRIDCNSISERNQLFSRLREIAAIALAHGCVRLTVNLVRAGYPSIPYRFDAEATFKSTSTQTENQ